MAALTGHSLVCFMTQVLITCWFSGHMIDTTLSSSASETTPAKHLSKEAVKLPGDIVLGGLFPLHDAGDERHLCGAIKEEKGIQRMEAMLFALDKINADDTILPNITLEQTMDFVKSSLASVESAAALNEYICTDGTVPKHSRRQPVVGVIGASSSSVSVMVANILRLFQIPQISYASTSVELSDKTRFGFFSRVVPPDSYQARAMVDIIKTFNWSYVSTVASEGDYGEKGIEYFKMMAAQEGICIAESAKISRNAKMADFDRIIDILSSKPNARGVVMFVDEDNCRKLLAASRRAGKVGQFLWLASDSWGSKTYPIRGQEETALGAITILPKRKPLKG
ncbi:Metabotropic glutamate receptor 4 [Halotydeus destructor]|nr:Metabotropic glutamate receptor 4 [Halotydeus destructor]